MILLGRNLAMANAIPAALAMAGIRKMPSRCAPFSPNGRAGRVTIGWHLRLRRDWKP